MSHVIKAGPALDLRIDTNVINGTASGTTPIVSAWQRLASVGAAHLDLSTGSGTNVVWSAKVARDVLGAGAMALPNPPTWPTGTAQSGAVDITMPGGDYVYLQLTATPSAGSSTVTATYGEITGAPVSIALQRQVGMFYVVPSTDDLAGDHGLDFSGNYDSRVMNSANTVTPLLCNTPTVPAAWCPAVDEDQGGYSIESVAGTGQVLALRLGLVEFVGVRSRFTPSAGSGSLRVYCNGKS